MIRGPTLTDRQFISEPMDTSRPRSLCGATRSQAAGVINAAGVMIGIHFNKLATSLFAPF